jgi:PAS domain S-box-containing protein
VTDTDGSDRVLHATNQLREFERRASADGLFLRFCRARYRSIWMRHVMTAIGTVGLVAAGHVTIGLICFLLAVIGEGIDCLVLRAIDRRSGEADLPSSARPLAVATGIVQALTIAACVTLVWIGIDTEGAKFFAITFLFGTAINAGIARPYFRIGADARLGVYLACLTGLVFRDVFLQNHLGTSRSEQMLIAIAIATLCAVAGMFILFVLRTHAQRQRIEHALLTGTRHLEISREELVAKERAARRLALVARHANDSVIITDAQGLIEWVNDTFIRMTGFSQDEVKGRNPGDVLNGEGTDPVASAEIEAARQDGRPARVEILNRRKDGGALWIETSLTPVFDEDGHHQMTIAVERDISEAKEREAELAQARVAAERAAQAKSRFLATMSHEIRTPMNGVIGTAQLLAETRLDENQKHYVDLIVEAGEALLTIINDILDLSKLQAGRLQIDPRPFDIAACLAASVEILAPMAQIRGIELTLASGDTPKALLGDSGRLRQILINLIGNAVKFTPEGHVDVRLSLHDAGDRVMAEISVLDTGIGIPADRLDYVFDTFTQANDGISRNFGGTGLGLAISRLLAREMGGDITARSELGMGSVFTLTLPFARAEDQRIAPPVADTKVLPCSLDGKRILIADDNATNRMVVSRMLAGLGLDLSFAADGAAAVETYGSAAPDLVLMDVSMPVLNGLDATREIRCLEAAGRSGRCPIIALTANAFADDRETCLAAGMDDFLTKPIRKDELVACIGLHLGGTPPVAKVAGF